ncbi:MAG: ECF transporter S component [bacterium]|nr:ECF transporter S component [bacterium]
MVEPNDPSRPSSAGRQPVLLGLFAGTAVGGGYLLAWLPNVEIMTVITAVAGVVLGPVLGFLCGAMAAAIYSIASPMGAAPPLLLLAQMLGMGLAGPVGHVAAGRVAGVAGRVSRRAVARAAAGGLVATVLYDALTNLAGLLIFDLPLPVVLVGAVPFFLVHAASNVAIFAVFLPVLAPRMAPLARPRVTGRPGTPGAAACLTVGLIVASVTLAAAPGQAQDSLPETGAVVPGGHASRPRPRPSGPRTPASSQPQRNRCRCPGPHPCPPAAAHRAGRGRSGSPSTRPGSPGQTASLRG